MKLVFSALCVAVIGLTGTVTEASMIHAVGVDNQNTSTNDGVITSWADFDLTNDNVNTISTATKNVTSRVVDGIPFSYVITVTGVGLPNEPGSLRLSSGAGLLSVDGTSINVGEGFDLTISSISSSAVQFDGFVQISYGGGAGGSEGASISEGGTPTNYTAGSNGLSAALSPIATTSTLKWRGITSHGDNHDARYIDFQFSVVPEPGAGALVGLGLLAMGAGGIRRLRQRREAQPAH